MSWLPILSYCHDCFFHRETVPSFSLVQKRPLLKRTQGCSLTTQRSYRAISAHIFHDDLPFHDHKLFSPSSSSEWSHLLDNDFRLVTAVESERRMVSEILGADTGVVLWVTAGSPLNPSNRTQL